MKSAFMISTSIALCGLLPAVVLGSDYPPDAIEFFEKEVRPLLAKSCWQCHGDAKPKAKLRLTSRAAILAGGASGPAAVPGKPLESRLLNAVRYVGDLHMPPTGKLTDRQIEVLDRWIRLGMPWPETPVTAAKTPAPETSAKQQPYWAFQPVKVTRPAVRDDAWAVTEVDRYILAGLEARGLKPAPRGPGNLAAPGNVRLDWAATDARGT